MTPEDKGLLVHVKILPILLMLVCLAGCVTGEVLVAKSAAVPDGVNFSGQWRLRNAGKETIPRERPTKKGGTVHVFLETGSNLKVTQTIFGIFVSFDRAIVEEYRFGEHRSVSVGPLVASRVSGWEGEAYVIETLHKDGEKLVERYRLEDSDSRLVRQISIWFKDIRTMQIEQVFDRM